MKLTDMVQVTRVRRHAALLILPLVLALATSISVAAGGKPLLMSGKSSLYQRILTRPGALLRASPDTNGKVLQRLPPLSVFFVYDRKSVGPDTWLQLGTTDLGFKKGSHGWLRGAEAIDWKQTLTVAFTGPAGREPTLFFRHRDELTKLIESESLVREIDQIRRRISTGQISQDFPVLSIEPATHIDPNRHFYLLPILDFEEDEIYMETGHSARVLNVAAVTLREGDEDTLEAGGINAGMKTDESLLRDYRAGIVFVIDTTSSMGPYIERTREAVRRIYRKQKAAPWGRQLSFGLIAYRDNLEAAPGLGYLTRTYASLEDGLQEDTFFRRVDQVRAASVSSKGFNEDAYAAVLEAVQHFDWRGYDGRFVVLITDAGARGAKDPRSKVRLGAERLRLLAQDMDRRRDGAKVAIYVMHLLTPEGRHTHETASGQYRELSRWEDAGSLYFPVQGGAVDAFGKQVDALASSLARQVEIASAGKITDVPVAGHTTGLEHKTALVGRAMQLAYLGRKTGVEAPRLFSAWVADRDLVTQSKKTLEVRVLITRNQLSDLQETLEAIFEAGESVTGLGTDPADFFLQLRRAAATLARDPEDLREVAVRRLADIGTIGEWLDDLPYRSPIMNITEARWLRKSHSQQQEVLDAIEEKIVLYQKIHDDTDRWNRLDVRVNKGDAVTTIPLEALP